MLFEYRTPWTAPAKYVSECACGATTTMIMAPECWGLVHACESSDVGGKTCRCGNGAFVFRLASPKRRAQLERTRQA